MISGEYHQTFFLSFTSKHSVTGQFSPETDLIQAFGQIAKNFHRLGGSREISA
jgi:hypothetical protein